MVKLLCKGQRPYGALAACFCKVRVSSKGWQWNQNCYVSYVSLGLLASGNFRESDVSPVHCCLPDSMAHEHDQTDMLTDKARK
jgi:hypothetical protein